MKLSSLVLSVSLALTTVSTVRADDNNNASEKQILFTMATISAAQQRCSNIEFNLRGAGWALIAWLNRADQDYVNNWSVSVAKLVAAASLFPTFCDDVRGAYGPKGIPAPRLPWATPAFRGMLK
jgi:hypothetical protein